MEKLHGLTLVEAMGCGTPIVAFRVGGIPEAAPDGQVAILCGHRGMALHHPGYYQAGIAAASRQAWALAHEMVHDRNAASFVLHAFAQLYRECVSSRERTKRKEPALAR